jgi:hypothetical protein
MVFPLLTSIPSSWMPVPCQLRKNIVSVLWGEDVTELFLPDLDSKNTESLFDKLPDGVGFTSGEDEVLGSVLLKHRPHALDVITG